MQNTTQVLLLQGPLGPFFADLATALEAHNAITHRICFNGGDALYARPNQVVCFEQGHSHWRDFIRAYLVNNTIKTVICYGDCRFYHREAKQVCSELGIDFWVLEEGYLRPSFVTCELGGVNANSPIFNNCNLVLQHNKLDVSKRKTPKIGDVFSRQAYFAIRYYIAKQCSNSIYEAAIHHRQGNAFYEATCWLKGALTKYTHLYKDRIRAKAFIQKYEQNLFLFPLQTHNDAQLTVHSDFNSIEDSIKHVMSNFAQFAGAHQALLIKHHPHDRGFTHYCALIDQLMKNYCLEGRVIYVFEYRLPKIYDFLAGCVTINSTVGLSALHHSVPTIVLGKAIYNLPKLTFQGHLTDFWLQAKRPNYNDVRQFKANLFTQTQIDGSFYKFRQATAKDIASKVTHSPRLAHFNP